MLYEECKFDIREPEYDKHFWDAVRGSKVYSNALRKGETIHGSVFVPPAVNTKFQAALQSESLFRQLATNHYAYHGAYRLYVKDTDDFAAFVPEGGEIPVYDNIDNFVELTVERHKLAAFVRLDRDFISDAAFNLEDYLIERFARTIGRAETNAFINGTGEDMPTGILNEDKGAWVSVKTSDLSYDDIISLYFSLDGQYREKGVWMMNDATAMELKMLKDSAGNYLWPNGDDTLLGKPVIISEFMPDAEEGKIPVVFGDFSYYWVLTRSPLSLRTLHDKFAAINQIGYLAFEFVDGKLLRRDAIQALKITSGEA